jgi:predicted phage replisome organizer
MSEKKYYWLKLKRDFFKRHDIRIIESMENGKDYVLFYLKLLLESVDHDGALRFSETIPYNDKMLSTITNTNIDIVRAAVKMFTELNMMEQLDDGTLFMNQIEQMTGTETTWAEKKRVYRREQLKIGQKEDIVLEMSSKCPSSVHSMSDKSKSIEIESEKEEEFPTPSKPRQVYSPTDESVATRFERHRKAWNYAELPGGRFLFLNLTPDDNSAVKTIYNVYSDDEIEKAIQNYKTVISGAEYDLPEKFQYGTFVAFLKKGVVQYVDSAKPLEKKRRQISDKPEPERRPGEIVVPENKCACCGATWKTTQSSCPHCHYDGGDIDEHREWYFTRYGERLPEMVE